MAELDVRTYLARDLPALLARAGKLDRRAVIQWLIVDRDDCDLTYRFGERGLEVTSDLADDVDLTLAFVSADLEAFAKQQLDVARALRTRRLKITGDESLLAWMAERLVGQERGRAQPELDPREPREGQHPRDVSHRRWRPSRLTR